MLAPSCFVFRFSATRRAMLSAVASMAAVSALAAVSGVAVTLPAHAGGLPHSHLYPIGGAYETALRGYAREVMRHAQGAAVRMVMVPAAFADDPVLPEDPGILAEDVAALQAACEAVLDKARFPAGCDVRSVPLYVAADASDAAVLLGLSDPALDGVFFNGGDQGYAMRILANSPAEAALRTAAERGVVVGGTSAGAAIESYVMNAGYTDAGDSTTGLQKASIDMWFGRPAGQRGLSFGSQQLVIDEHVYSRGRLGRMLNATAQTADAVGNGGLLGLGFDYDTGGAINRDRLLSGITGVSSGVVVDFQSASARYSWVGANAALSARHVLTHLLPPSPAVAFDLAHRVPLLAGQRMLWHEGWREPLSLRTDARATVILGGDVSQDLEGPVLQALVRQAQRRSGGTLLVVASAYATPADAQADAELYAQAVVKAGWRGLTRTLVQGQAPLDEALLKNAAAVLFVGGDQSRLPAALADGKLGRFAQAAAAQASVLMFDHAMSAAAGEHYNAIAEGDTADDAIAAFQAGNAVLKPGLGLVRGGAFEPRLQTDKRWGRLYGIGALRKRTGVWGISESSAIVLQGERARVIGPNPVVALDARRATFMTGDNGALGAFNVLLDVFEHGEALGD
jgi:cyanophycinase